VTVLAIRLWTPTNRLANFDAASFILGGEIRNRTNTHKKIHKQWPIYPHLAYIGVYWRVWVINVVLRAIVQ